MSRVLLRWTETELVEDQFKLLTYDGYWSRVMFYKSQLRLSHRQIWEKVESELALLDASAYISYDSFKKAIQRYVSKQESIYINPEDYDCRLFSYEGYWDAVMDIRQETKDISVKELYDIVESKLDRIGLGRYKSLSSFTTHYFNYIKRKLKK